MWVDRLLTWLFPTLILQGTEWESVWRNKERADFVRIARVLYPIIACAYVFHFYAFDRPMALEPIERWQHFRFSMAGLAIATFLFYQSRAPNSLSWYKLPSAVVGAIICFFQARVLVWYDESIYFYAFGFAIVATIILRLGIALSLLYVSALIALQWTSFLEAGIDIPLLYSATVITLVFVVFARTSYGAEIKFFRASQENIDNQRQLIELNLEFTERLRAFLPREISRRLFSYIERRRMTVVQAIEEVLRPKSKEITCLFSDIRGFTKQTQTSSGYVDEGVIPNVRRCTRAVENHGGIPRKVGDLIFAYFDNPDVRENVLNCIAAAVDLVEANNLFNDANANVKIIRNVLVASGPAVVGNLGGFDSSIEITALGNPVNLLSRIDELVKHPRVRIRLQPTDIVLDENTASLLEAVLSPAPKLRPLSLHQLGVSIRDFEDTSTIWLLSAGKETRQLLKLPPTTSEEHAVEHVRDIGGKVQAVRA